MQELTPAICKDAKENATDQLKDIRDGKLYWVTKLKDGNCWMTQNLNYDITTEDIPNIRRYDATTGLDPQTEPAKTDIGRWPDNTREGSDGIPRYYDPGYYYYTNTNSWEACTNVSNGLADANCETAGWKTTGDAHFSVGNYYNWYAATKGSGTNDTVGEASDNICPAGWQLPKSNVDESGSFGTMITTDGQPSTNKNSLAGKYHWVDNVDGAGALLRGFPYYFVSSGLVRSGLLLSAGYDAFYWSSTASGAGYTYALAFVPTRVAPTAGHFMSNGFSVRCIVLGS